MFSPVDVETRLLARLHPERNGRGLNIYNPYFQETNANVVYLLFHNPDPQVLLRGIRSLAIPGAVVAGSFEKDPAVPHLLDSLDPVSEEIGTIGMVAQREGQLWGAYQGCYGLRDAIERICPSFREKSIAIIGAGVVVHGLLALLKIESAGHPSISIFNRTVGRAEQLAAKYSDVTQVAPLADLDTFAGADILVNATNIGSPWNSGEPYHFSEDLLRKFQYVVDVTFVPLETQLTTDARKLGLQVSPGHQMFLHQAKFILRRTLGIEMNEEIYQRHMLSDFETNWA